LYVLVRILKVTPRFTGFLSINEYEIEADRHAGGTQTVTRLVMERGHAVGVLAYDPARDEVVLVNEIRPGQVADGVQAFSDALVAGVIEAGEDPLATAVREMKEEAGLELRDARVIHPGAYVSPGGTSEKIVLVFGHVDASAASGIHGHPDEHEDALTVVLPAEEFIACAKCGTIDDMKTVLAAWWLADYRRSVTTATA
jgi:ADP-ribose pyrophosphatase